MKNKKSRLDEMQEQELLKVEHNGCWIAFWGLIAALAVQMIVFRGTDFKTLAGEWIVLMVLSVYLCFGCMRRGIWDRRLPMNTKTNVLVSLAASLALGAITAVMVFRNYGKPAGTAVSALITAAFTFVLCLIALTMTMKNTEKRIRQLEEEPDDADSI